MYEACAGRSFDLVEPFASRLQNEQRSGSSGRELLQQIGWPCSANTIWSAAWR